MKIKRTMSVLSAMLIMLTAVCGCFAVSANAAGTMTYSYVISTSEAVNAFEGKVFYPKESLSVESITFSGQKNDKIGTILFNDSNVSVPFNFSGGQTLITVVFNVNGDYNVSDIYTEITDFYSNATVATGNIPFDYSNVIDGEVVSCGHTDIDTPANSYVNKKYVVTYNYKENPGAQTKTKYIKDVWSNLNNAKRIAEFGMPKINNPYYTYSVDTANYSGSYTTIYAVMSETDKQYTVYLDGTEQGEYAYLDMTTVTTSGQKDFLINGVRVASGTSFSFYVTGDTNITTESPTGTVSESATLVSNALYVSDYGQTAAKVKMELLASATSTNFKRMGVAFATESRSVNDIKAAVKSINTGTGTSNKIAVHNSRVDNPNISGQYQFIYAPYVSVSKVSGNTQLFFYSYVENNDNTITISQASQVSFSNVLA